MLRIYEDAFKILVPSFLGEKQGTVGYFALSVHYHKRK